MNQQRSTEFGQFCHFTDFSLKWIKRKRKLCHIWKVNTCALILCIMKCEDWTIRKKLLELSSKINTKPATKRENDTQTSNNKINEKSKEIEAAFILHYIYISSLCHTITYVSESISVVSMQISRSLLMNEYNSSFIYNKCKRRIHKKKKSGGTMCVYGDNIGYATKWR